MNTQSIKSRVISGSSCSARMRFHSSFACWLSSVSSQFRSSKRPSSVRFKSSGRKSEVRPQGDGQAAQSGAMMAFCLWICSTRSLEAEAESGLPGVTDERAAKRTGAVPSGISFASAARESPMRAQMTASCSGVRPEVFVVVERDISVTFLNKKCLFSTFIVTCKNLFRIGYTDGIFRKNWQGRDFILRSVHRC